MPARRDPETGLTRRGVSNGNERGSSKARRSRKIFLLETYAADVRALKVTFEDGEVVTVLSKSSEDFDRVWKTESDAMRDHGDPVEIEEVRCCRCYRCGKPLVFETLTVDRIVPGCRKTAEFPKGGTYRRSNIRPACGDCNSETGGALANAKALKRKKVTGRRGHRIETLEVAV
jgi:hypothetical protein